MDNVIIIVNQNTRHIIQFFSEIYDSKNLGRNIKDPVVAAKLYPIFSKMTCYTPAT